jgi:hypothetical protein
MGRDCVDDEPSLGSLDARISQLRWAEPDRAVLWPHQDFEYDPAEHEDDPADHEGGIEDMPHDATMPPFGKMSFDNFKNE